MIGEPVHMYCPKFKDQRSDNGGDMLGKNSCPV